ncbi:MAG: bifunctional tRNA (5-methylaminomethyl-2-thiouridine)(34)-methyltransferase MnmD/FAD-dependent 5-carboxymethylaminomethyl-2-thiouridine(34) oxidoreductase MnmC [Alphaproteobacteria bacterium]|nr:bifunctional tRNA (5-methylaminomethyl-2-thiouridine)(34)-methyltransferase MnmD/FAD-dependent 5-carboxymethylaminomethyl-2-thiouridine(34) oxidoreductase MnmC [Alphaproteobacteria bacterium]
MKRPPYSSQFDDIYFSAEDGLAETNHVFLQGNDLLRGWAGQDQFVIAETGFGTGLNFLAVWDLFEKTADADQQLDFISFEKYPLAPDEIREALEPWKSEFRSKIERLLDLYPLRVAGFHRVKINDQITLTLIFDDVNDALPELQASVDCWFLDGFTPAKNPDMWSETLFTQMARLSHRETSYATFTAAGDVRRGLEAAGFSVEKKKGFGKKRDMISGRFVKGRNKPLLSKVKRDTKIAIIGGGLAGTSMAYALNAYGFKPVIYEASSRLASGASGNSTGLYNPRFTAQRGSVSNFFAPAFVLAHATFKSIREEVGFNPCGALHLINSEQKQKRFEALIRNWRWHSDHIQLLDIEEASDIAGIKLDKPALYLPDAGYVSPKKLCEFYARDIEVKYNSRIEDISTLEEDAVILTGAYQTKNMQGFEWLPIHTVRGQITEVEETSLSSNIKSNIQYGGYMSPSVKGRHVVGSTFQKWLTHEEIQAEDDAQNITKLKENIGVFKDENFAVKNARASLRTTTPDHFPIVGELPGFEHVYASLAFGSHGLVGSIMVAYLIADYLRAGPVCLPEKTVNALEAQRFIGRAAKKGEVLSAF